jgi:diguanylate cyclase (GGDEF)-like protein
MSQVWRDAAAPPPPFRRAGLAGRVIPLAIAGALAFIVLDQLAVVRFGLLPLAAGLGFVALVLVAPWDRAPRWAHAAPPLLAITGLGAFRMFAGSPDEPLGRAFTIFSPILLTTLWLALHHTRRELLLGLGLAAAAFIGPAIWTYSGPEIGRGIAYTLLVALIGYTVHGLVRRGRDQAAEMAAVAHVVRSISREDPETARVAVCQGVLAVCGGAGAILLEPTSRRARLHTTAAANQRLPEMAFPIDESSAEVPPVKAFLTGEPVLSDSFADYPAAVARKVRPSLASSLCQPVFRDAEPVGVLMVTWSHRRRHLNERTADAVRLFADEAAVVIQQADLLARLEASALTDVLTQAANRRAWDQELPLAVARAARGGMPLCVAIVDLDRFKALNDKQGHQAGDRILRQVGRAWRQTLRQIDFFARYGGDEFAIILPDCSLPSAERILDRLRLATPADVGCSAGLADWNGTETPQQLVARADAALYEAKRTGTGLVAAQQPKRDARLAAAR